MEKDIGKINKNDTTDILIRVDDFAEKRGLTIREFVTSDRYTGFTKSGVRILSDDFKNFKEMINSISEDDMKQPEDSEDDASQEGAGASDSASEPQKQNEQKQELGDVADKEKPKEQATLDESNPDY